MLNRAKPIISGVAERVAAQEEKFNMGMQEIQKVTANQALAEQFPDWDLKPPALLIKRRSSKIG
ncbi:hypothetical protein B1748_31370 [Paenibacillus sp. MY03]|uniref:hypothetical protein n=1 Tax=Paenibacillus sp. MY03 TaxID=302980 RepID=UPI000B3C7B59|nr:hypothetical protein [Paenibacillus sp. MY03]OUS69483.1 hypothetical protein B1748_31370 [Paenibacillus sp. MY03]